MGQGECIKVLEKNKGWMDVRQIAEILNQAKNSVNRSLKRLFETDEIYRRVASIGRYGYKYEWREKDGI